MVEITQLLSDQALRGKVEGWFIVSLVVMIMVIRPHPIEITGRVNAAHISLSMCQGFDYID